MSKQSSAETLSRQTGDRLRREILAGGWAPGEKLPLAALSKQYETPNTVIREALTWLAEGLLAGGFRFQSTSAK